MFELFENIIGKTAHWGRHTFEATKDGEITKIVIYPNYSKKVEAIVEVSSIEELLQKSIDGVLHYYTGELTGQRNVSSNPTKPQWIPTIEYFLWCFRYDTKA